MRTNIQELVASVAGALTFVVVGAADDRLFPIGLTPEQEQILSYQSLVQLPDGLGGTVEAIRFSGVNVQVVNALGATNGAPAAPDSLDPLVTRTNGRGNVILGYREALPGQAWTGSHNLDVGGQNTYSSFGGAVLGQSGALSGPFATITGGDAGTASGEHASVAGGSQCTASGVASMVGGGYQNDADGPYSVIWGGHTNLVETGADYGAIRGGDHGIASGNYSTILGGTSGEVGGYGATILAGRYCEASGLYAAVAGSFCQATGTNAAVLGGRGNVASGSHATVAGGQENGAESDFSFVGGGYSNTVNGFGTYGSVGGGSSNVVQGSYGVVSGGYFRSINGAYDWRAGSLFEDF